MSFTGKVAIVTGAGQGIGLEICRRLANAGAKVILNDLDNALATEAVKASKTADKQYAGRIFATRLSRVICNPPISFVSNLYRGQKNRSRTNGIRGRFRYNRVHVAGEGGELHLPVEGGLGIFLFAQSSMTSMTSIASVPSIIMCVTPLNFPLYEGSSSAI